MLVCDCQTVLVVEPVPTPNFPGSKEVEVQQRDERSSGFYTRVCMSVYCIPPLMGLSVKWRQMQKADTNCKTNTPKNLSSAFYA